MSQLRVQKTNRFAGETAVPGDKSISHRVLILGALTRGQNRVRGWLPAGDTLATLEAMRALGMMVEQVGHNLTFSTNGLKAPGSPIDCANAGTLMRVLAGLLVGQPFASVLDGSEQLRVRPMARITEPLALMGANIRDTDGKAPLHIEPANLTGIELPLEVASAQVKSALILAGLHAEATTTIIEPGPARDHTERLLTDMGAPITVSGSTVRVSRLEDTLPPIDMTVPGDVSSAAFIVSAAACIPGADIRLYNIGLNPTRTGLLDALRRMGAEISVDEMDEQGGELAGVLHVTGSQMHGITIEGDDVVRAIDELPVLAVAATQADGETVIKDAQELRVKEVDRISRVVSELRKMGVQIEERIDGMTITGPTRLTGAHVNSYGDHRMAMALTVAGMIADGETVIEDAECISDSFPGFAQNLTNLGAKLG